MPRSNNKHPYPAWNDNMADRIRNRGEDQQVENNAQHVKDLSKVQRQADKGNR